MDEENKAYWIAGPETTAKIEAYVERRKVFNAAYNTFKEKYGGKCGYGTDDYVPGWCFSKDPGEGWRKDRAQYDLFVPRRSTVAGKAVAKDLDALRYDSDFGIRGHYGNHKVFNPGFHLSAGRYVVVHHPDAEMPADCRRIKASEYWAMREAQGE